MDQSDKRRSERHQLEAGLWEPRDRARDQDRDRDRDGEGVMPHPGADYPPTNAVRLPGTATITLLFVAWGCPVEGRH